MQYVEKVGDYVYNQWNSLNPATLSGAIDIIVIEQPDGSLHTSPWHVRFGFLQILKPSQKKIELYVNEVKTNLPMKLSDGGEAFFVFETTNGGEGLSKSVLTSPVISPVHSPDASPSGSPRSSRPTSPQPQDEPDDLDLESKIQLTPSGSPKSKGSPRIPGSPSSTSNSMRAPNSPGSPALLEKARKITQKLNIPSKIDVNGDMVLDMDGYKSNARKNIENSDEYFKKLLIKEIQSLEAGNLSQKDQDNIVGDIDASAKEHGVSIDDEIKLWDKIISRDSNGNVRISNQPLSHAHTLGELSLEEDMDGSGLLNSDDSESHVSVQIKPNTSEKTYFKTLRLTNEQLQSMNLKYGRNTLRFKAAEGTSQVHANLYLWKSHTPIVISDIDGTITKSDALGHVLNMIGRDWTHTGVAGLFQDISRNGYNIVYLTARSVGQADTTRQYLEGVTQEGIRLPKGPVILSPDRTMAALKREIVLKKPEVFKMACLNDIRSLYFDSNINRKNDDTDELTPFYAGFGNRITDAISYRSVKIPSHRIFTINPDGEVNMELLQLAGYKSSYIHIGELVDHFFPPIKAVSGWNAGWNNNQLNEYINKRENDEIRLNMGLQDYENDDAKSFEDLQTDERFNDVNYWRQPVNFDDLSDEDDAVKSDNSKEFRKEDSKEPPIPKSPKSPTLRGVGGSRPSSMSFSSPLKSFMMFGDKDANSQKKHKDAVDESGDDTDEDDYDDADYDDDDVDDDDDDEEDDEDDYDDDYEDDYDDVDDVDDDDIDQDDLDLQDDVDEADEEEGELHDDLNQTFSKTTQENTEVA